MYAYNHLIRESEIVDRAKIIKRANLGNKKHKKNTVSNTSHIDTKINYVDVNYYEIISTRYKSDARDLIITLQNKFSIGIGSDNNAKSRITYHENYPLFQYLGYSVDIFFDDNIICRMYHYNEKCVPYFDVPALYFKARGFDDNKGTIRIGSFAILMLYNLINVMKAKSNNDNNTKNLYYTIISHMTEMKNYYFLRTKKTIFDDSLFQEFILRCVGDTASAQMEKANRIDKKIKAGKKYSWSYNPANEKNKNNNERYVFKNSSGNPINNEKNNKIDLTETVIDNDINDINDINDDGDTQ